MKSSRPHDETVVELLKVDPDFAAVYLAAALDEADEPGGNMPCWQHCARLPRRRA